MNVEFIKASEYDAEEFVKVQNKAFYLDFKKYGACPGYGRTPVSMIASIKQYYHTYKIVVDGKIIGKVSANEKEKGKCHLGCLCIIPEYENKGIGKKAVKFIESKFKDATEWTLETPKDKVKNHHFYKSLGYEIIGEMTEEKGVHLSIFYKKV